MRVRDLHDIKQWIKFFLVGVIETAQIGVETFDKLLKLKDKTDQGLKALGSRSIIAGKVVDFLYQKPIISAKDVAQVTDLSLASSYKLIKDLEALGILHETTGAQRGRLYTFKEYVKLFQ